MRIVLLVGIIIGAAALTSCGGASSDLSAKRAELKRVKDKIRVLDKKVAILEQDIAILDTTREEALIAVKVQEVHAGAFTNSIGIQGTVSSDNDITMNAEMGGTVQQIYVKEGQKVSKGQTLLKIDGAQIASQLAQLKNALELSTIAYNKQKRLWDQKIGSEMQYLQAKNQKQDMENQINTINAQASKFILRAPISGTVDKIFINQGEVAGAGMPMIQVVDSRKVKIEASVSESYIGKFKVGDEVMVKYPALGLEAKEKIAAVSEAINPETRTFSITILPKNHTNELKPNLLTTISAADYKSDKSITVLTKLIRKEGEKRFVYVVVDGAEGKPIVAKRYIEIKQSFSTNSVLSSGLNEGDQVIIEGFQAVLENDEVKVVK